MFRLCILLIVFYSGFCNPVFAQLNFNLYKKAQYKWDDPAPVPIPTESTFANEDVVYTADHQVVMVSGSLGLTNYVIIQRRARLKFLNENGIAHHSKITIPESMDPLFDYHNEPFKNNLIKKGPDYFEGVLNRFSTRIIKPDGTVKEAVYTDEFKSKEVLSIILQQSFSYKYFKSYYWNFLFSNLQPGDELEYDYELSIPYEENWLIFNSGRIFLHGETSCQNYELIFKYKIGPTHDIRFINGANPDSSNLVDKYKSYYWTRKNLPGCLDEPGSIGYLSLPHVIYSLDTRGNHNRYNDAETAEFKYIPYWLTILRVREVFDYSMRKNAAIELKDKQNLLIDAFIKEHTAGIPDSMNFQKFKILHTTIADSFKYENDEALFRQEENRGERMGEFTASHKIREISRYKLYAKLINELNLNYFSFYLMDKRYGKLNEDFQGPVWNIEGMYAIYLDKYFAMVHPKKSDNGWYMEEIPFYWENTSGLLQNYNDLFYDFLEKPRVINTLQSTLNDNVRMCNVQAKANLTDGSISFDARISLSGQYSTMTRFVYTSGSCDSTINYLYSKKISDISTPTQLKSQEIKTHKSTFPYRFEVVNSYVSDHAIRQLQDGSYAIDLSGWFNHIIYEKFDTTARVLDFYPDFVGQDTYRYYIQFDRPVKIVSNPESAELKNSFASVKIKVSQIQPDGILIESFFATTSNKVDAAKIAEVANAYRTIEGLNRSNLVIRPE